MATAAGLSAGERITFPTDPGVLDAKRDFGAKGDGATDDTAALQVGLEASSERGAGGATRVLFLPHGIYRVTNTLVIKARVGPWVCGESRDGVVIRLADGAPTNVTAVIRTHPSDQEAGSADWFMRYLRNFTVDTGANPHVDGIRWFGNNSSTVKEVCIRGTGKVAVNSGFLGQNGPNLVQDVVIEGSFETGVRSAWNWGQTLSRVTVRNARKEGIYVNATAVGIEDLVVENTPVALRNEYPNDWTWWGGVVALVGGRFTGSDPSQPAITNTSAIPPTGCARTTTARPLVTTVTTRRRCNRRLMPPPPRAEPSSIFVASAEAIRTGTTSTARCACMAVCACSWGWGLGASLGESTDAWWWMTAPRRW